MSWVAIERAVRIALERGLPADLVRWQSVRDRIYHQIMAKGWNEQRGRRSSSTTERTSSTRASW